LKRRRVIRQLGLLAAGAFCAPRWLKAGQAPPVVDRGEMPLPPVTFHNLHEFEPLPDGGWRLSRVPATLRSKLNESAQTRAYAPAGAELRFNLPETSEARVYLRSVENRSERSRHLPVLAEIHYGDVFAEWIVVRDDWTEIAVRAPPRNPAAIRASSAQPARFAPELIRVALPYLPEVQLLKIEGDVSPSRPEQMPLQRYLAYGSSITNGAFAARPGDLYPARIARALGVDHFNLGFGGGAHLEPEMADWIASRSDWDFATLEMGINLVGRLTAEQFEARVNAFLPRIAAARPDKRLFCIDMFTARGDFTDDPKYPAFRQIVREAVDRVSSAHVVHCDGRRLLTRVAGLTLDLTHPSSDGFEEIAHRLVEVMRPLIAE
jgi:lysophospholipase L1-like esterase